MSLTINNNNYNKYNRVIDELQDYMFNLKNINQFVPLSKSVEPKPISKSINNSKSINKSINKPIVKATPTNNLPNIFTTLEKDNLFWILYVMKNGTFSYDLCASQRFSIEQQAKFDYIKMIRENKDKLKAHNVKSIKDLETDLANNKEISLKTFAALCILEGMNIIYLDGRKFYESTISDDDKWFLIKKNKSANSNYTLEMDIARDKLDNYKLSYYQLESLDKVGLKSMSGYKVDDLVVISKKLNIELPQDKKLTKQVLYELIIQNF